MESLNPHLVFESSILFFESTIMFLSLGALAPGAQNGGCYMNPHFLGPGELPPGGPKATPYYLRHGTDGFTSPPTASAGFEPANLGTKGQHATPRPPKLVIFSMAMSFIYTKIY